MDKFLNNQANQDLITEYEATEGTYPFDFCKYELMEKIQEFQKINKACVFGNTLYSALQNAIHYQEPVTDSLLGIISSFVQDSSSGGYNTTQTYFKEIGEIYKKHKGDLNLEYCPENREKLIELNTKMVISVAKQYQNLGLTLDELISAGNLGLCVAWDKYDPAKARLKDDLLEAIKDLPDSCPYDIIEQKVDSFFKYGSLKTKFTEHFKPGHTYPKTELETWINKNVFNAKFSSICNMWIKAYILIEIDNCSRIVKKPKSEIYKDKEKDGSYKKETILNLDTPITNSTDTTFADTLGMEDESETDLNITEAYDEYKAGLNKLLEGVNARDRSIVLKRYGIGCVRPLTPKELSEDCGLSIARISLLLMNTLATMRKNASKYEIDPAFLFEACSKFR